MRRSSSLSTLMLVGLAAAMATSFAVGLRAVQKQASAHNHCLNGCGKGQKPPGCCEPPKCEFEYELRVTTAKARSFARTKRQMQPGPGGGQFTYTGPSSGQIAAVVNRLTGGVVDLKAVLDRKEDAVKQEAAKFAQCSTERPFIQQQPFYVDVDSSNCGISQNGTKIDHNDRNALEKAKDADPHCRERVEAAWAYATTMQDYCQKNYPLNPATRQEAEQKASEAAQRSMQEQLSQFIGSCKPFIKDSKDAREAVKKAEAMLKDSGGKYIPQAKRTLSGRSRQQAGRGGRS